MEFLEAISTFFFCVVLFMDHLDIVRKRLPRATLLISPTCAHSMGQDGKFISCKVRLSRLVPILAVKSGIIT